MNAALLVVLLSAAFAKPNDPTISEIKALTQSSHSSAVIVEKNGQVLFQSGEPNFNTVYSGQSITKSLTALGYLLMMQEGSADSLDTPISKYYPNAVRPAFDSVTIRSLFTHSSGIDDPENLWDGRNIVATTLAQAPQRAPFGFFSYSNAGAMLLGDIVNQQVQSRLGSALCTASPCAPSRYFPNYLADRLLNPLGIQSWSFSDDQFGHLQTSGGFSTTPLALLRIGKMLLAGGHWQGKSVLARDYVNVLSDPKVGITPCYALMTWLVNSKCGGTSGSIQGDPTDVKERHAGFYFDGYGGQYVVVIPETGVVAVRMKAINDQDAMEQVHNDSFLTFPDLISRLQ